MALGKTKVVHYNKLKKYVELHVDTSISQDTALDSQNLFNQIVLLDLVLRQMIVLEEYSGSCQTLLKVLVQV